MGIRRDLIVESNGHCFICLTKIPTETNHGNSAHLSGSRPHSIHSIQSLSRYLKMDVEKVLNEDKSIPANSLTSAEKSEFQLHSKLEKSQMEVTSSLDRIYAILVGLRMDAIEKCSRRIHSSSPRVRLHNMTRNGMTNEKLKDSSAYTGAKCQRSKKPHVIPEYFPEYLIATGNLKLELPNPISSSEERNELEDNWNDADLDNNGWEHSNNSATANVSAPKEVKCDIRTFKVNDTGKPTCRQTTRFQHDKRNKAKRSMPSVNSKDTNFAHTSSVGKGQHKIPPSVFENKTGMRKCPSCHKPFSNTNSFQRHYKSLHLQSRYCCTLCDKQFAQKAHCQDHHRGAHLGVKFSRSVCHRQYPYRQSLTRHLRLTPCGREIAPKPKKETIECIACGKGFSNKNKLQRHFKEVHMRIRMFSCGKCGREFSRQKRLTQHEIRVHGPEL